MTIFVNGEAITKKFATLYDVCAFFSDDAEAVATAVNGDFVPKTLRQTTLITDGDHIDIIAPLEGG
jgi:sulfur carrier protein